MKKLTNILLGLAIAGTMVSCKVDDPFVDRVVSPVLVQVMGSDGAYSNGMSADPTVTAPFGAKTSVGIRLLELDKTNILDHTKGIDSIPASAVSLLVKFRGGAEIGSFTTGSDGLAKVEIPWSELGVSKAGETVALTASGTYKDVSFTKLFKIASK